MILLLVASACSDEEVGAPSGPSSTTTTQAVTSSSTISSATSTSAQTTTTTESTTTTTSPTQSLLGSMSLRQKAAQAMLVGFMGTESFELSPDLLADGPPGGVLLLQRNIQSPEQLRALTGGLQKNAAAAGSGIGLLVAIDQEGGPVRRIKDGVTFVPAAREVAETMTPEEAGALATQTASELLDLGINMNLAPVADVVSDGGSFLYRRSYSGDPETAAAYVAAVVSGFLREGLIAVPKHFPGHGAADGNTHTEEAVAQATAADYESVHLPPFEAGFEAGAEAVMVAHIVAAAYDSEHPASSSPAVVEGLLREQLGFRGVVITDDIQMSAASTGGGEASSGAVAVDCLRAGCDLILTLGQVETQLAIIDAIVTAVDDGSLSEDRLDEAVLRILKLKQSKHLQPFD